MKRKTEREKMAIFVPQMYSVLKELQESASYWSEYDVPLGIVDRINDVLEKVENIQKTYRKEYQRQYQKEYAASGKKSEAAKRYYQKHKYEINEKLQNKRKNLQINK